MKNTNKTLIGAGVFSAIAASLCCIAPVLALLSGVSGLASSFSWIEAARPYLLIFSILTLAFAWYQKLKPRTDEEIQCDCEEGERFIQSKLFLGIVSVFALLMISFPYYADQFYPEKESKDFERLQASNTIQELNFRIDGMTCNACASHIENDVTKLSGILKVTASYETASAKVAFDKTKIKRSEIEKAINKTGYKVLAEKE